MRNIFSFFKDILFNPAKLYRQLGRPDFKARTIISLTSFSVFITAIKCVYFYKEPFKYAKSIFFDDSLDILNVVIGIISIPIISLFLSYSFFGLYILLIYFLLRVRNNSRYELSLKRLSLSFMSIVSLGIIIHLGFYLLYAVSVNGLAIKIFYYFAIFWINILYIIAIKYTQKVSFLRSIVVVVLFLFLSLGRTAPFLAFLEIGR